MKAEIGEYNNKATESLRLWHFIKMIKCYIFLLRMMLGESLQEEKKKITYLLK